jgi:hypothetical protein
MIDRASKTDDNDAECRQKASETLTAFSNHLMLVLIAVIAFSAAAGLSNDALWAELVFIAGVVFALASFVLGYEGNIHHINAYLLTDKTFRLRPKEQRFDAGRIDQIKRLVFIQYVCVLLSLLLILVATTAAVLKDADEEKDTIKCWIEQSGQIRCPATVSIKPSGQSGK